jgi:hypothetical protein
VRQIDIKSGEIIKVWDSAKDAARSFNKENNSGAITNVCQNYKTKEGYVCKSAFGYKWEYAN